MTATTHQPPDLSRATTVRLLAARRADWLVDHDCQRAEEWIDLFIAQGVEDRAAIVALETREAHHLARIRALTAELRRRPPAPRRPAWRDRLGVALVVPGVALRRLWAGATGDRRHETTGGWLLWLALVGACVAVYARFGV